MMASTDNGGESVITAQPTVHQNNDPKRKVSIVTDPLSINDNRLGHDNHAFEPNNRGRKISQNSEHSEVGPVRRKSILHNTAPDNESLHSNHDHKHSSHKKQSDPKLEPDNLEQSWIYALCMRCRGQHVQQSWEPPHWQKFCPYPLCPSYRQFSRIISLILIVVLLWFTVYVIIGDTAGPGGQLFQLVILTIAANFGGFLMSLTTLPRLIGMLLVGILFQNVGFVDIDEHFGELTGILRKLALVIILTRAGLEMDHEAFKKVYVTILKLGLIPWTVECVVVALMTHYLLDLPWMWAFALGSIIAAVSPAVVVPCLFRLRTKGYGVAKGIPTLIIAVAGIDDAASVAIFGIITSLMFSAGDLAYQIAQAPVCIFGGLGFGVIWGYLSKFVPEKGDAYAVPIRTLLLFGGGLLAVFGSEHMKYEGAGPLGVVFAAFISNYFWCQQGWDVEDNPVSTAFEIFWMIFEPILFGITGAAVKINELDPHIVSIGVACLAAGVIIRILSTISIAFGDRLNVKEKIFVSLSWMAKATVQAALGPVALKHLGSDATPEEKHYGEIVLMICILSIVLTAPTGAILISITGTKLLTKTKQPHVVEGWRRSHRPSLRDISIIDEEDDIDDAEANNHNNQHSNLHTNTHTNTPIYTVTK